MAALNEVPIGLYACQAILFDRLMWSCDHLIPRDAFCLLSQSSEKMELSFCQGLTWNNMEKRGLVIGAQNLKWTEWTENEHFKENFRMVLESLVTRQEWCLMRPCEKFTNVQIFYLGPTQWLNKQVTTINRLHTTVNQHVPICSHVITFALRCSHVMFQFSIFMS